MTCQQRHTAVRTHSVIAGSKMCSNVRVPLAPIDASRVKAITAGMCAATVERKQ